jgi:SAM-dependent methyltransferase
MSEMHSFHYSGISELEKIESNLKNYNNFIVSRFVQHSRAVSVVDFGAGIGTLSTIWKNLNKNVSITCIEIDQNLISILKERGLVVRKDFDTNIKVDYIFTSNVLEHIEDDQSTLSSFYHHLNVNGKIGIFVPANPLLYSHVDKKLEHFRRYSKAELEEKVKQAGFKIDECTFLDSLGLFAWLFVKVFKLEIHNERSSLLTIYDKLLWPISKSLDQLGLRFFFGKNLILLASKN